MSHRNDCFGEYDIVDFHSHILPALDHGSDNLEMSLSQIDLAEKNGVKRILATSHFYPNQHNVTDFLEMRSNAAKELKSSISADGVQFKLGAEVLVCDGLERLPDLNKLCFQGTKYILIELPFFDFTENMATTIEAITEQGLNVILAHADRYPKRVIEYLLDCGVKTLQINATAFKNRLKNRHVYKWVKSGFVGMIGSDIHGDDKKAYRNFLLAKKRLSKFLPYIKETSDTIWGKIEEVQ